VKSILAAKLQPLFPSVPAFNSAEEFDNWFDEFGYGIWKDRMKHQQGTRQSEAVSIADKVLVLLHGSRCDLNTPVGAQRGPWSRCCGDTLLLPTCR
jgi:hypothetical protein